MQKLDALIESERFPEAEECDVETSEKIKNAKNKTKILIKKLKNCKPFIGVSILFLCFSIILIGIMIYFCLKPRKNNTLP